MYLRRARFGGAGTVRIRGNQPGTDRLESRSFVLCERFGRIRQRPCTLSAGLGDGAAKEIDRDDGAGTHRRGAREQCATGQACWGVVTHIVLAGAPILVPSLHQVSPGRRNDHKER